MFAKNGGEFERSSISYVQENCSFYETNLSRSFHKSNFACGKRWAESLLSARFFANTMLYIVAKCAKNLRIGVLEMNFEFEKKNHFEKKLTLWFENIQLK